MTIIILGSSGFVGKALVSKLSENGVKSKNMVRYKKNLKKNEFFGDITKEKFLEGKISDNDTIINLIGQTNKKTSNLFDENIIGTFNLLNLVKKKKNIKIIFASSTTIYGENSKKAAKESDEIYPTTDYQIVKSIAENIYQTYSKTYGINVIVLRFSNIYGPDKETGIIANCLKSNKSNPITIDHNGNQVRDFLFIDDAIQGIINTIQTPLKGFNILNISSGRGIKIKEVLKLIENTLDKKITVKFTSKSFDKKNLFAKNLRAKKFIKFNTKITLKQGLKLVYNKKIT
jgi:UDP-glucose 4-epimerase